MHIFLFLALACKPIAPLAPAHCINATDTHLSTEDGAEVSLHRHPASGPPVVLIHGISSNHHFWDLTEEHSLTAMLADSGFDAWALDLRGHGDARFTEAGRRQQHGWSIDDYGRYDLHAAISHIREMTGHEKIAIIGHSMGGMVAAAYNGHHGDDALSALVVVGSPISFVSTDILSRLGPAGLSLASLWRSIGSQTFAKLSSRMPDALPVHGEGILYTAKNMAPRMRRFMLDRVVSPVSREELGQLKNTLKQQRFTSLDGALDYESLLSGMDIPLLAIGGGGDKVVPIDAVAAWVDHVGSADETFIEMSESQGHAADYGHLDLVLGDAAREEVLNPIVSWIETRIRP
jgi:pimeloyl-ACP methyl ester carboxylesterase